MPISTDPRSMEKLQQLETVLELLQNPELYSRMLAEVQSVLARYEAVTQRYSSVEQAENFLREARSMLDSTRRAVKEKEGALAQAKANFEADQAKREAALVERETAITRREQQLAADQKILADSSMDLKLRSVAFAEYYEKQNEALGNKQAELAARERTLDETAASLKAVLAKAA